MAQTGLRILLIETSRLMADITGYRLELLGYRVVLAASAVEVWATIERAAPHAIVLSLDSEELDGFGLLEKFSSDPRTTEIPILALSAEADLDRVERAWKDGARDYIVTPYDPQSLEQKVGRLLANVKPQLETSADPSAETTVESQPETTVASQPAVPVKPEATGSGMSPAEEQLLAAIDKCVPPVGSTRDQSPQGRATDKYATATTLDWLN